MYKVLEICLTHLQAIKFLKFMLYGMYVDTDLEILGMKGFELKFGDLSPGNVLEKSLKFVSEKGFGKRSCL